MALLLIQPSSQGILLSHGCTDPGGAELGQDSGLEPGQFRGLQTGRSGIADLSEAPWPEGQSNVEETLVTSEHGHHHCHHVPPQQAQG